MSIALYIAWIIPHYCKHARITVLTDLQVSLLQLGSRIRSLQGVHHATISDVTSIHKYYTIQALAVPVSVVGASLISLTLT